MANINLKEIILKCNRCGFCQDVCPTYRKTKNEANVARGRIRLARLITEGKYNWGEEVEITEHINSCLLCKACVVNCPSTVVTDEIMMKAREEINNASGFKLFHKLLYRGLFSHQKRFQRVASIGRFYNKSGARWLVRNSGVLNAFKKIKHIEQILPEWTSPPFRQILPNLKKQIRNPKYKIGYFVGCATNTFFSEIAEATMLYLQSRGCSVEVPEVNCCGGPHRSAGDIEEARRLAKENILQFYDKEYDFILSDCATCASALKEYENIFTSDDGEIFEKAQNFSKKVLDVNKFIADFLLPDEELISSINKRVSYHDPCHLVRGLGVSKEPRQILSSVPGLEFVEMNEADWCCGGAGSYCVTHQELSTKILEDKINNFLQTGADILATSCPACIMQLSSGLRKKGSKKKVKHPVELLAESAGVLSK